MANRKYETSRRPLVFLDFDDVICLNSPYGGYDAKRAMNDGSFCVQEELHSKLFNAQAKAYLEQIYDEFNPYFVLSTSWWWLYKKDELVTVLQSCGLRFVSKNLHPTWATPKQQRQGLRAAEVKAWLNLHPEFSELWVVLDDKLSGQGFSFWSQHERAYVVLCQEGTGLTAIEFKQLNDALLRRVNK